MMKRILYISAFLVFSCSCSNFLKEDAQNLTYVESIKDLDEVLLGDGYIETKQEEVEDAAIPTWIHLLDDDAKVQPMSQNYDMAGGVYTWQKSPTENMFGNQPVVKDNTWKYLYKKINALNIILYELEEYQDEADYNRIKGEALFLRAGYYWWLVNIYAKAYDVKTADNDPGVPLKLTEYVEDYEEDGGFSRASVAQVYEQIVKDLQASVSALSGYGVKSVYRASEHAARLFLSRVYLHMENYEGVVSECRAILENSPFRLQDYRNVGNNPLVTANSTEVLFSQGGNGLRMYCGCGNFGLSQGSEFAVESFLPMYMCSVYIMSDELLNTFSSQDFFADQASRNDIRYTQGFTTVSDMVMSYTTAYGIPYKSKAFVNSLVSDRFTLRLAEAYLNMAEALALSGKDGEASELLLTLREHRLAEQTDRTALQGEQLIRAIRAERRMEFNFEGFRWFDLRRYAVNSVLSEKNPIKHVWYEVTDMGMVPSTYILKPYGEDAAWVFPIPSSEHRLNENMVENEERPIRNAEEN